MDVDGASTLPDGLHRWLARAIPVVGLAALLLASLAHIPQPSAPAALSCNGEARWTETCRAVQPEGLAEAVAPPELARRLAATWDFGPDNQLWRAGGAPLHLAQRARALRNGDTTPLHRARAAASLAKVLEAPLSYGAWEPSPEALEAVDAEAVAALYADQADQLWTAHQEVVRAEWEGRKAAQTAIQGPLKQLVWPLGFTWLVLGTLGLLVALERLRALRPLEIGLDAHHLHLDGQAINLALIDDVDVRWGRLELLLRDGTRWVSRPLEPRNPARLELLLKAAVHAREDAFEERDARNRAHQALSGVLSRARSS